MTNTKEFELATQEMLIAEKALMEHVCNAPYDPGQEQKLLEAVRAAKAELVDRVGSLFPDIIRRP